MWEYLFAKIPAASTTPIIYSLYHGLPTYEQAPEYRCSAVLSTHNPQQFHLEKLCTVGSFQLSLLILKTYGTETCWY